MIKFQLQFIGSGASDSEDGGSGSHYFEGVEKLLEVWFTNQEDSKSAPSGPGSNRKTKAALEREMRRNNASGTPELNKSDLRKIPR